MAEAVLAWLGLGGNVGAVRETMRTALQLLDRRPAIEVRRVSALYETPPWGKTDQPPFLNACAEISTELPPDGLLSACLAVEQALHRKRRERWGPRTIDIDILAMEGIAVEMPGLAVPHPRLAERAFALMPLAELAPDLFVSGDSVAGWLARADTAGIRRVASAEGWYGETGASFD